MERGHEMGGRIIKVKSLKTRVEKVSPKGWRKSKENSYELTENTDL